MQQNIRIQESTKHETQRRLALFLKGRKNEKGVEEERKEKNQKNGGKLHAL